MTPLDNRLAAVRPYWDAYWYGKVPMLLSIPPKEGVTPVDKPGWGDRLHRSAEDIADQLLAWEETHEFLGGAVPGYVTSIHTGFVPCTLGAELQTCGESHRPIPCIEDLSTAQIFFDPGRPVWQTFLETAQVLKERCGDRILISSPTLGGNLDTLDALYGTTELLFAMVDQPENVKRCLDMIDIAHRQMMDACDEIFDVQKLGAINRHDMYCDGRIGIPQCDFSCMLGPEMFAEQGIPFIQKEMARLNAVEYHLDGPDAIVHLENLCGIPELQLIQWVPGAGNERRDWSDLFRRIDELGKGQLRGGSIAQFEHANATLTAGWLYWRLGGASAPEMNACIRNIYPSLPG